MKTERQKAMERERSRLWRLQNPEKVKEDDPEIFRRLVRYLETESIPS